MRFHVALAVLLASTMAHADILIGDGNGDGKIDAHDLVPAYDLIWRKQETNLLNVAAMDIDGNGIVDSDDYIDLAEAIYKHTALGSRPTPDRPLKVVPRSADAYWWKPKAERLETEINVMVEKLNLRTISSEKWIDYFMPGRLGKQPLIDALNHYNILKTDTIFALKLQLLDGTSQRRACNEVEWHRARAESLEAVLEKWENDRPPGRDYVDSCAKRLKPGVYQRTGIGPIEACASYYFLSHPRMLPYNYKIEVANGRMRLKLPARVGYSKNFERSLVGAAEQKWIEATQCATDFWSRYGIDFELDYESEPLFSIMLHPGMKRSDFINIYIDDNPLENCATVVHELGHHLGFKDEYATKADDCPNRPMGEENSMMNYKKGGRVYAEGLLGMHLTRGNLDTVLGSICGTPPKNLK